MKFIKKNSLIIKIILGIMIIFLIFLLLFYNKKIIISDFYKEMIVNVITALIGAYAVVKMTNKQIKESRKIDGERLIIEHRPLLKYEFIPYGKYSKNVKQISTDFELGHQFRYNLEIENNGLDIVKKYSVEFKADFYLEKELITYGMIKRNEKEIITFIFEKLKYGDYDIKNIITYQDVLGNWYNQDISFKLRVYEQQIDITNILITDEKIIQKENIF